MLNVTERSSIAQRHVNFRSGQGVAAWEPAEEPGDTRYIDRFDVWPDTMVGGIFWEESIPGADLEVEYNTHPYLTHHFGVIFPEMPTFRKSRRAPNPRGQTGPVTLEFAGWVNPNPVYQRVEAEFDRIAK